jgi:hypothetical protein
MMHASRLLPLLFLALAGCRSVAAPPTFAWRGIDPALAEMSRRAAAITTASGTAALTLRRADGNEVRLDAAFAARPPQSLRVRAWKFDRAVADWTLTDEGVWAWQSADAQERAPAMTPWTGGHSAIWPLLFGIVERRPDDQIADDGSATFQLRRHIGQVRAVVVIDRATLTVVECRVLGAHGGLIQGAKLHDYRLIGGQLWPMRVIADGQGGTFTIHFNEVTLNEDLAPDAFKPPARAKLLRGGDAPGP